MTEYAVPGARLLALAAVSLSIGCGSYTSGTGELGRMTYRLQSDFESEADDFGEAVLVTGHPQYIITDLTADGIKKAGGEEGLIAHEIDSSDVTINWEPGEATDDVPNVTLTASEPGTYTLTSTLDGDDFDYIDITFGRPTALEILTWLLRPGAEEWELQEGKGTHAVEVGTQVTFLPVPLRKQKRLVGDVDVDLSVDTDGMVAQGENVLAVYEQRVIASSQPVTLFFIEAGDVQIELTDTPNDVRAKVDFSVE